MSLASAVAAAAHLAAAFGHRESSLLVGLFVSVGVMQIASGLWFLRGADRRAPFVVATTTVMLLAAWAASRTVGLAIGHAHGPERAAALDLTAVAAQVTVLLAVVGVPSRRATSMRWGTAAFAVALAAAGVASRSHAPDDHHAPPYASTPSPASLDSTDVPSPTPPASAACPGADPEANTGHEPSGDVEPHDHP